MEIIAEFGCNWNDRDDWRAMILRCQELGIKYVKMQLWKKEQVPKHVQHMYLDERTATYMHHWARNRDIELFFTPFYPEAVDICERIGVNYYKIRYADNKNGELISKIWETKKPIFISGDKDSKYYLHFPARYIGLFCVPKYPATFEDYYQDTTMIFQGYSDHTPDLRFFNLAKNMSYVDWFEMHVCLDDNCYERAWSKTFDELEEVL